MSYLRLSSSRCTDQVTHQTSKTTFSFSKFARKMLKSSIAIQREPEEPGVYPIDIRKPTEGIESDQEIDVSDEFISSSIFSGHSYDDLSSNSYDTRISSNSSIYRHYRGDEDINDNDNEIMDKIQYPIVIEDYVTMRAQELSSLNDKEDTEDIHIENGIQIEATIEIEHIMDTNQRTTSSENSVDSQVDSPVDLWTKSVKPVNSPTNSRTNSIRNIFRNGFRIMNHQSNDSGSNTQHIEEHFEIPKGRLDDNEYSPYESGYGSYHESEEEEESEPESRSEISESRSERTRRHYEWMSPSKEQIEIDNVSKLFSETFVLLTDADFETDEEVGDDELESDNWGYMRA